MSAKPTKFERHHEAAIAALLRTTTLQAAAREAGVNERTLRRWWELPAFQAKYRAAKRELISGAMHTLLHATGTATHTLITIMQDAQQPATARVSAARTVLQLVMQALSNDDINARFMAIEQRLDEQEQGGLRGRRSPAA
jgi:transposase-like protein